MNRKTRRILNIMKWIFIILATITSSLYIVQSNSKKYLVRVDFCDNREPVTIKVNALWAPDNSDISTYKEAVPRYKGYLNVCNVTTISKL